MKCRLQDELFILYPGLLTFDSKENINFEIRCAITGTAQGEGLGGL